MKCELCDQHAQLLTPVSSFTVYGLHVCQDCERLIRTHKAKPFSKVMECVALSRGRLLHQQKKKEVTNMVTQSTKVPSPQQIDLLRRLFSDDKDVRDAAIDEWAPQPGPLFSSQDELSAALKILAIERHNEKKGGENNGQQQQGAHQARAA